MKIECFSSGREVFVFGEMILRDSELLLELIPEHLNRYFPSPSVKVLQSPIKASFRFFQAVRE